MILALQSAPRRQARNPRGRYVARILGALVAEFLAGMFGAIGGQR